MFRYLLSVWARSMLWICGWSGVDENYFKLLRYHKRVVGLFPHTSYFDSIILSFYLMAYPELSRAIKTLVMPQLFPRWGWILRRVGAIEATKVEDKGNGAVERIIKTLENEKCFVLLISPKGTIRKTEWRSGYFWITKGLNCKLAIIGLDYEKKTILVPYIQALQSCDTPESLQPSLSKIMGTIVPLRPSKEVVPVRIHDPKKVSVVSWGRLISVIIVLILIWKFVVA